MRRVRLIAAIGTLMAFLVASAYAEELVTMTIPGEEGVETETKSVTQEDLDAGAGEWYNSAVLNADGSITYTVKKELKEETLRGIIKSIEDMACSDEYPTFVSVKVNDDMTEFEIVTTSEELTMQESLSQFIFLYSSALYHTINETYPVPEDVVISFISEKTGEVLLETHSDDFG